MRRAGLKLWDDLNPVLCPALPYRNERTGPSQVLVIIPWNFTRVSFSYCYHAMKRERFDMSDLPLAKKPKNLYLTSIGLKYELPVDEEWLDVWFSDEYLIAIDQNFIYKYDRQTLNLVQSSPSKIRKSDSIKLFKAGPASEIIMAVSSKRKSQDLSFVEYHLPSLRFLRACPLPADLFDLADQFLVYQAPAARHVQFVLSNTFEYSTIKSIALSSKKTMLTHLQLHKDGNLHLTFSSGFSKLYIFQPQPHHRVNYQNVFPLGDVYSIEKLTSNYLLIAEKYTGRLKIVSVEHGRCEWWGPLHSDLVHDLTGVFVDPPYVIATGFVHKDAKHWGIDLWRIEEDEDEYQQQLQRKTKENVPFQEKTSSKKKKSSGKKNKLSDEDDDDEDGEEEGEDDYQGSKKSGGEGGSSAGGGEGSETSENEDDEDKKGEDYVSIIYNEQVNGIRLSPVSKLRQYLNFRQSPKRVRYDSKNHSVLAFFKPTLRFEEDEEVDDGYDSSSGEDEAQGLRGSQATPTMSSQYQRGRRSRRRDYNDKQMSRKKKPKYKVVLCEFCCDSDYPVVTSETSDHVLQPTVFCASPLVIPNFETRNPSSSSSGSQKMKKAMKDEDEEEEVEVEQEDDGSKNISEQPPLPNGQDGDPKWVMTQKMEVPLPIDDKWLCFSLIFQDVYRGHRITFDTKYNCLLKLFKDNSGEKILTPQILQAFISLLDRHYLENGDVLERLVKSKIPLENYKFSIHVLMPLLRKKIRIGEIESARYIASIIINLAAKFASQKDRIFKFFENLVEKVKKDPSKTTFVNMLTQNLPYVQGEDDDEEEE